MSDGHVIQVQGSSLLLVAVGTVVTFALAVWRFRFE